MGQGLAEAVGAFRPQPLALVFDYDGTLAHLPVDWHQARARFREFLHTHGLAAGCPEGLRLDETEAWALNQYPEQAERILSFRRAIEEEAAPNPRPIEGTLAFVRALPAEAPRLFVISNNLHQTVVDGLDALGLTSRFERIVGLDDTGSPKPDIRAASLLEQENAVVWSRAIFIGDSESTDGLFCARLDVPFINVSPEVA
ncbi:MAG: HAD family hydrolase [Opitutales bacterium]